MNLLTESEQPEGNSPLALAHPAPEEMNASMGPD
jgi:hypothetical protein